MPTRDPKRAALLAAARAVLGAGVGEPVVVVAALGRAVVLTDGPGAPPDPSRLPPAQRAVYEALVGGPLTARALARRLRRKYNSNFRSLLARMTRAGLIHREAGRYVRQGDARTGDSHPDQNA